MNKKMFVPATLVAIMGLGAYFAHATATPDHESDLLLANAEALAQDNETDYSMGCITGIKYTGGYNMTMYCTTCSFWYGYVANGSPSRCNKI
ncbi:MAG: hypothetical protein K2K40_06100 [Paramuribaculum sp.]|nr:hypothetical protein [Paramuribaculum sp.]MDE7151457.1 hypothetical protein [Candidatus Amulumruptor sp.]